jgi:DNA polymerase III epsilon subunit-like protein
MGTYRFPRWRTVALDLECTGLNRNRDRIIQYGIWGVESDGETITSLSALVDAETDVGRDPANIPGISRREVYEAVPLRAGHLDRIYQACNNAVLVIHNKHFDWSFIENEFKRNLAEPPRPRLVCCTWEIARKAGLAPPHTLGVLCERLAIPLAQAHNAFHDARATFQLFVALANAHWDRWFAQQIRLRGCWVVRSKYFLPKDRNLRRIALHSMGMAHSWGSMATL